jgi:hypothetical protein
MPDPCVEVKTTVKFIRLQTPNFVQIAQPPGDADRTSPSSIPIKDLDQDGLDAMAEAWLEDFYGKADKRSPFELPVKALTP